MMALGDPQVSQGSSGEDVKAAQRLLAVMRYDVGPVDGYYGTRTRAAVKEFQQKIGLPDDGIIGVETWKALRTGFKPLSPNIPGPMVPDAPYKAGASALSLSSMGIFAAIAGTLLFSGFFKKS